MQACAPEGTAFCAGCQSFRDLEDFTKSATTCRACASAAAHEAMVGKTYGLRPGDYARLLEVQNGKCAICRMPPKSVRLSVDHAHDSGVVRGLLNSKCNHEALGALHDSPQLAWNAYLYLTCPPATVDDWGAFLDAHPMPSVDKFISDSAVDKVITAESPSESHPESQVETPTPLGHLVGAEAVPGKRGVWRYWVEDQRAEPPF